MSLITDGKFARATELVTIWNTVSYGATDRRHQHRDSPLPGSRISLCIGSDHARIARNSIHGRRGFIVKRPRTGWTLYVSVGSSVGRPNRLGHAAYAKLGAAHHNSRGLRWIRNADP